MAHLAQEEVFFDEDTLFFFFEPTLVGDVEDRDQHLLFFVVIAYGAGIDEHGALAEPGKVMRDLKILDRGLFARHLLEQCAQLGDIPLSVAEIIKHRALGVFARQFKPFVEGMTGDDDAQVFVEYDQRLMDSVDDRPCKQVTAYRIAEGVNPDSLLVCSQSYA